MKEEKSERLVKIKLTGPVKIGKNWYDSGRVVKVNRSDAADIILNHVGEFTDPEDSFVKDDLKDLRINPSNPDANKRQKLREEIISELCNVDGISTEIAENLIDSGFTSINDVFNAEEEELIKIKGIGKKSAPKIIESAGDLAEEEVIEDDK
jgi:DNA-directed RNA polymerase alpha subunit